MKTRTKFVLARHTQHPCLATRSALALRNGQGHAEVRAAAHALHLAMRVAGQIHAKANDDPLPASPLTPLRAPAAPRLASTLNAPIFRSLIAEATAPSPAASPASRRVLRFSSPATPTPSRSAHHVC